MLREGFILFEKRTDVLHSSKYTTADSLTGSRVRSDVATITTFKISHICQHERQGCLGSALVHIGLQCVTSLHSLDKSPSPLEAVSALPAAVDEMHPSEILTSKIVWNDDKRVRLQ